MTPSTSTTGPQSVEALATRFTEAMISLIGTSQEQAIRQADRSKSLSTGISETAAQLADATFETMAGIGRANLDVVLTFNQLAILSADVWGREMFAFNRALLDKGLDAGLRMLETHSAEELIAAQTDLLKVGVDEALAESAKLYEMAVKVADAALVPLGGPIANTVTPFARSKKVA